MPPSGSAVLVRVTFSLFMSSTLCSDHTQQLDFQSLGHLLLALVLQHTLFVNHGARCIPRQEPTYSLCPKCFLVDASGAPRQAQSILWCPTFPWMPYHSEWESPVFKCWAVLVWDASQTLRWVDLNVPSPLYWYLWCSLVIIGILPLIPEDCEQFSRTESLACHNWTCRAGRITAHASLLNSFIYTWLLIILGWPESSFRFVSKMVPKTSMNFLANAILLVLHEHLLHAGPHSTHVTFIIQLSLKNPLR